MKDPVIEHAAIDERRERPQGNPDRSDQEFARRKFLRQPDRRLVLKKPQSVLAAQDHFRKILRNGQQPLRKHVADGLKRELDRPVNAYRVAPGQQQPAPLQGLADVGAGKRLAHGDEQPSDVHGLARCELRQVG